MSEKEAGRSKKKAGRPRKVASGNSITLPVNTTIDITNCSELVAFLNGNIGKSFTVVMDGTDYTLVAG